jgi:hypothetical protein
MNVKSNVEIFSILKKKISICSRRSYSSIINKINWTGKLVGFIWWILAVVIYNKLFIFMCNEYFIKKKRDKINKFFLC